MNSSTRGAAKVSIMWMISVGVVALVGIVLAITANNDVTAARNAERAAQQEAQAAVDQRTASIEKYGNLAEVVGWRGENGIGDSNLEAIADAKSLLRDNFDLDESDETFESMLPKLVAEVNKYKQMASDAEEAAAQARQSADQSRADLSTITSQKDSTIDDQK